MLSFTSLTIDNIYVSSACFSHLIFTTFERSNVDELKTTLCFLFERKSTIQLNINPLKE